MRLLPERELVKAVWSLAWPTVTYALLQSLVQMADVFMVGRLGRDAISGVGFSLQLMMLLMIGALAVSTGATTLVAQLVGAGEKREAGEAGRQAIITMFMFAGAVSVPVVILARPALRLMGADPPVLAHGVPYMQITFAGVALMGLNFAASAVFRGAGDVKTPVKIAAVTNAVNLVLNYLLIFGPGPVPALGVAGAALGTVSARGVAGIVSVVLLSRKGGKIRVRWANRLTLRPDLLRRMLRVGLPSAGAGFFRNGARVLFFRVVAATASHAVAIPALTVAFRMRMLAVMPALAFQVAATTLVGQAIGAGDRDRAGRLGWAAIRMCALIMVVVSAAVFVAARPITLLFHRDPSVYATSIQVLRSVAFGQVFSAVSIVTGGALAGAGDTRPALAYTVISQWLILLPLSILFGLVLGWDATGAWWAWAVAAVPHAGLALARFASGHWRRIRV